MKIQPFRLEIMRFSLLIFIAFTSINTYGQEKPRPKSAILFPKYFDRIDTCISHHNLTVHKQIHVFYDCDQQLFYATDSTLRKTLWKKKRRKLEDVPVWHIDKTWRKEYDFYILFENRKGYLLNSRKGKFKKVKSKKKRNSEL